MGTTTTMFVFVWMVNILIFLAQAAMIDMSPNPTIFYNTSGTILEEYSVNNSVYMPNSDLIASELPTAAESAQESESIVPFVDAISSIKSWIQDKIDYLVAIVMGPYTIIKAIPGLPQAFVNAIALLWYGLSLFLLIAFIFGRVV